MTPEIPERMRTNGRPANQHFSAEERLFHRFNAAMKKQVADVTIFQIRMPNTSVNREHPDGLPEDVLLPDWPNWGILCLRISRLPRLCRKGDGVPVHFRVVHDPEDANFYHCEIRAFGHPDDQAHLRDLPSAVKTTFRQELSQVIEVLRESGC